jgi:hypothetical protein
VVGATWYNTVCPDGYYTGTGGTCVGHLDA